MSVPRAKPKTRSQVADNRWLREHRRHAPRFKFPAAMIQIPDSVEGAVIISIVDFVLSFFIISGIGVVLALLPLVNRYWAIDDKDLKGGH